MVEGHYEQYSQPKMRAISVYSRLSNDQFTGQEMSLESVKLQTVYSCASERINLEPVYVMKETNELIYNSRMMEKGKEYHVDWDGERFMLIREEDSVNIYRFEEDVD